MIYDSSHNITWLADMNYAFTSGYTAGGAAAFSVFGANAIWADGEMGWNAANTWATNLIYGGYDDWRLPTLNSSDTSCSPVGFNCAGGELSGLFIVDLGYNNSGSGLIRNDNTSVQIANLALFSNVQSYAYWSGTGYAGAPDSAWALGTDAGVQLPNVPKSQPFFAVAVRSGDVLGVNGTAPEPHSLPLALTALAGLGLSHRRRTKAKKHVV